MGSLRNPVGPLPSSIYWRRRAVAASLVALLALLIVWVVTSGGDGGGKDGAGDGANGAAPVPSITPGPSQPGPAISNQPGGRDESGASGGSGGGTAPGTGQDDGKNGDTASGGGTGTGTSAGAGSDGSGGTGSSAGSGSGGSAGSVANQVPADSPLPDCAPGTLRVTLRSTKVSYAPGEKPRFELVARNTSGTTCKADFGPRTAVLTIKNSEADTVWSSKDCPRGAAPLMLRVPAGGSVTHTVEWDRRLSAPQCATPSGARAAGAGTYLLEAAVPGAKVLPASFTLAKD
ncbi:MULTISPECIES: hypothetical protein [unclassified Streptomyces]|uniref:hypothetical protein n=1 Tax=unclassified Streptomyces TaxID=2593676 RepID=UPI0033BA8664